MGTMKVGNQQKGKMKMAKLGCSNANCCTLVGADKKAFATMFMSNKRLATFQIKMVFVASLRFVKPK